VTTAEQLPPLPDKLTTRGGDPSLVRDELLHLIAQRIDAHPRSQQTRIGPSEIGMPCSRRLAHKLAGTPETNNRDAAWRPTVGTAVHTWLETALQAVNDTLTYDRFYLEERVDVGEIAGVSITGSCDCYDRVTATSIDWKIVGPTALKKYRKDGPGEQYRAQAHLYGRGWQRAGNPVDHVAVMFLPSNGELHDAHYWTEPYDEQVALAALNRANTIAQLVAAAGSAAAAVLPATDAHCRFCPYFQVGATDLTVACPGSTTDPQPAPATLADALL
jgi:hypothetical protein